MKYRIVCGLLKTSESKHVASWTFRMLLKFNVVLVYFIMAVDLVCENPHSADRTPDPVDTIMK